MAILNVNVYFFIITSFLLSSVLCLKCWDCNSAINAGCDDPFLEKSFSMTECDAEQNEGYRSVREKYGSNITQLCRKIIEKVDGKTRVIRKCGWLDDPRIASSCIKRIGTYGVTIKSCQCYEDGCNSVYGLKSPPLLTFLCPIFAITLLASRGLYH